MTLQEVPQCYVVVCDGCGLTFTQDDVTVHLTADDFADHGHDVLDAELWRVVGDGRHLCARCRCPCEGDECDEPNCVEHKRQEIDDACE